MKRIVFLLIVFLISIKLVNAGAINDQVQTCMKNGFVNSYYLIDLADISEVSSFYRQMGNSIFNELEDFSAIKGKRDRISTYYDFDDLELLKARKELFITLDINLPRYRTEREKIYYIKNLADKSDSISFEVKNYNKKTGPLDKHPLFRRIKRSERPILINEMKSVSNKVAENISEKIKVESTEIVYLITRYGIGHGAITLSSFNISNFGIANTSAVLKIELFPDKIEKLLPNEHQYVNALFCQTRELFQKQFPHLKSNNWFGYADYQNLAIKALPSHNFFKQHPLLFSVGQIIILSFIGFLILVLLLGRYTRADVYKTKIKSIK